MKKRGAIERILAIILSVSMMTSCIPTTAFASEQETVSDVQVQEVEAAVSQEQDTQATETEALEPFPKIPFQKKAKTPIRRRKPISGIKTRPRE